MVGSVIAADLGRDPEWRVTVADRSADALDAAARRAERFGATVHPVTADLADPDRIAALAGEADVVLGALASRLGFAALRSVIESGRPYCDISFMAEDPGELDALARERGVTAVVDCGVAPGMSNLLAGYATTLLDETQSLWIAVGGLPRERRLPFQYKAGFAPSDVLEEYTRPARIVEGGRVVVREALTEIEAVDFDGVGTLEAFNTDGLRSLIDTLDVPDMVEKGWGRIIQISSVNGEKGQAGQTNYSAAKAGMHGFSMALAQELASKGVTVNTVAPGYIGTDMVRAIKPEILEKIVNTIPVKRLGTPDEIASIVTWLAGDDSGFTTGAEFSCNGGLHMG
jgi:NAD(P)-dependent dehydrogenase (short-subunit alcohol dehydrogenase family)